jgi:hypothetical protein
MRAKILLSVPSMLDRKILIQNKFDAIFLSIAIDCDQPPCQVYGESWIADGRDRWRSLCFRTSVMYGNGNDEAGAVNNRKIPAANFTRKSERGQLESKICVGFVYKT